MALDNIPSASLAAAEGWDSDHLFGDLAQDPVMRSLLYTSSSPSSSSSSGDGGTPDFRPITVESSQENDGSTWRLWSTSTITGCVSSTDNSVTSTTALGAGSGLLRQPVAFPNLPNPNFRSGSAHHNPAQSDSITQSSCDSLSLGRVGAQLPSNHQQSSGSRSVLPSPQLVSTSEHSLGITNDLIETLSESGVEGRQQGVCTGMQLSSPSSLLSPTEDEGSVTVLMSGFANSNGESNSTVEEQVSSSSISGTGVVDSLGPPSAQASATPPSSGSLSSSSSSSSLQPSLYLPLGLSSNHMHGRDLVSQSCQQPQQQKQSDQEHQQQQQFHAQPQSQLQQPVAVPSHIMYHPRSHGSVGDNRWEGASSPGFPFPQSPYSSPTPSSIAQSPYSSSTPSSIAHLPDANDPVEQHFQNSFAAALKTELASPTCSNPPSNLPSSPHAQSPHTSMIGAPNQLTNLFSWPNGSPNSSGWPSFHQQQQQQSMLYNSNPFATTCSNGYLNHRTPNIDPRLLVGVEVMLRPAAHDIQLHGKEGVVKSMSTNGEALVFIYGQHRNFKLPVSYWFPVTPRIGDYVRVLAGSDRPGSIGMLFAVNGDEATVRLSTSTMDRSLQELHCLLSSLGRYSTVAYPSNIQARGVPNSHSYHPYFQQAPNGVHPSLQYSGYSPSNSTCLPPMPHPGRDANPLNRGNLFFSNGMQVAHLPPTTMSFPQGGVRNGGCRSSHMQRANSSATRNKGRVLTQAQMLGAQKLAIMKMMAQAQGEKKSLKSTEDLIEEILRRNSPPFNCGKRGESSELSTSAIRISLICPLSQKRMQYPCRGIHCLHPQCFDAEAYIDFNRTSKLKGKAKMGRNGLVLQAIPDQRWKCPLCHKPTPHHHLCIDRALMKLCEGAGCSEVELDDQGTWRPIEKQNKEDVIDLTLDSDEDDS